MTTERRNITQPATWWTAFEREAAKAGINLSKWVGQACREKLTERQQQRLGDRPKTGPIAKAKK